MSRGKKRRGVAWVNTRSPALSDTVIMAPSGSDLYKLGFRPVKGWNVRPKPAFAYRMGPSTMLEYRAMRGPFDNALAAGWSIYDAYHAAKELRRRELSGRNMEVWS